MKKLFTLLTLLLCVCSGAWAADISVTWLPNDMSSKTTAGTASTDDILTVSDFTTTNNITLGDPLTYDSKKWGNFTSTTRPTKNKIAPADYITFTVTVKEGYIFTPTSATAYWVGIGTGNNAAGLYTAIQESEVASAADNSSNAASTTQKSLALSGSYSSGQSVTFYIHIGQNNTTANKGLAIRDVVLTGTYTVASTDPAPASITTQPSNKEANVGVETTLSVEAAGYPIPTYQWYSCDDVNKTNAKAIDGATSASYSFTPGAVGTQYFYVTASNVYNESPVVATSNVATVTIINPIADAPTFKVYGNTVQLASATEGATIYYELNNPDVKTSGSKVEYAGAFIPASSGTIYAYAEKDGYIASDVASQAVALSTVGDVVGGKLVSMQPTTKDGSKYEEKTYSNNGFTLVSTNDLEASGRGVYTYHFKTSGTITVTAPSSNVIQSIKIIGTSNDGSKAATITAGNGATVISTPAELMPRDVTVGGVQTMTEIVVKADEPSAGNSISFTLGRESRFYVEVYGPESELTLSSTTGFNYGFGGFCAPANFTVTNGAAYKASLDGNAITLTKLDGVVPANTGVIIVGEKNATATINYTNDDAQVVTGNDLKGTTVRTLTSTLKGNYDKFLTLQKSTSKFIEYAGEYFPANRAYIATNTTLTSKEMSFDIKFADATSVKNVEAITSANGPKAIKKAIVNGRLVILTEKGYVNALGQTVK